VVDEPDDVAVGVVQRNEAPRRDVERLLVELEALRAPPRVRGVDVLDVEPDAAGPVPGAAGARMR